MVLIRNKIVRNMPIAHWCNVWCWWWSFHCLLQRFETKGRNYLVYIFRYNILLHYNLEWMIEYFRALTISPIGGVPLRPIILQLVSIKPPQCERMSRNFLKMLVIFFFYFILFCSKSYKTENKKKKSMYAVVISHCYIIQTNKLATN